MNGKPNSPDKVFKNRLGCLGIIIFIGVIYFMYNSGKNASENQDVETQVTDTTGVSDFIKDSENRTDSIKKLSPKDRIKYAHSLLSKTKVYDMDISEFESLATDLKDTEYSKAINITLDSLKKKREIQLELESSIERKVYQEGLRNIFLDAGLDIKVKVYGKNNTSIKLTYALFSDVWFRKFETQGTFNDIHSKGFKRIELSDNYDYGRYIYWN